MQRSVLWIDNDRVFLRPHVWRLKTHGYSVDQVFTLTQGLQKLESGKYDLLILDVMLPANPADEDLFPEESSEEGRRLGLLFYRRYKPMLEQRGIITFVFTIREDKEIKGEFLNSGLPAQNYMTKQEGTDKGVFFARVEDLLRNRRGEKSSKS
jgi:CheY-like chemotaxis protein